MYLLNLALQNGGHQEGWFTGATCLQTAHGILQWNPPRKFTRKKRKANDILGQDAVDIRLSALEIFAVDTDGGKGGDEQVEEEAEAEEKG